MAQMKPKKRFVAEILRDQGKLPADSPEFDGVPVDNEVARTRHEETLAAIVDLKNFISQLAGKGPVTQPVTQADAPPKIEDSADIRSQLQSLRDAIVNTKREIAAVRHPSASSDPLLAATDQLDAVVAATEQATHTILQSVETIDEMAERIKQSSNDAFVSRTAEEMRELIVKIFEACNFQDITGQRITKVVNTMKFVEERVIAMIAIWGPDSFAEIEVPEAPTVEGEKALLNGPQLGTEGVSQADIDKLFG